jgi:hypothetical protein
LRLGFQVWDLGFRASCGVLKVKSSGVMIFRVKGVWRVGFTAGEAVAVVQDSRFRVWYSGERGSAVQD